MSIGQIIHGHLELFGSIVDTPYIRTYLAGVYLTLMGMVRPNNSDIMIDEIGNSGDNRLQCVTDRMPCCSTQPNRAGVWYFPGDGGRVPLIVSGLTMATTFYRNRGDDGTVNLNRVNNDVTVMMPTGQYCCEVLDATGVNQTACAFITCKT